MSLRIAGLGTAVPENAIIQDEAAEVGKSFCPEGNRQVRLIPALYRRTGVKKRHSVLLQNPNGDVWGRQSLYSPSEGEGDRGPTTEARMQQYEALAPALAFEASRRAIDDSGIDAGEITHSVTVSCTGFNAPGLDSGLIRELGLAPTVERTHVGFMGCHGALNGLRVASSFVGSDPDARVLVCAVELCSLHFFYGWDTEKVVANALFADGAGAVVGVPVQHEGSGENWQVIANGTFLIPGSEDAMSWRIADHGFQMTLSPRVPELIKEHVPGWLEGWLHHHGLTMESVGSWAVHPGGSRILSAFRQAAKLENGALAVSREVLAEYGNMSSATVLFILERMRQRGARRPCVALGFGPGMVVEAALFD